MSGWVDAIGLQLQFLLRYFPERLRGQFSINVRRRGLCRNKFNNKESRPGLV